MSATTPNTHTKENLVYLGTWIITISLLILHSISEQPPTTSPALTLNIISVGIIVVTPYILLFAVNNYLLIPRLLFRQRITRYILTLIVVLVLIGILRHYIMTSLPILGHGAHRPPLLHHRPLFPLPLFHYLVYAILTIGGNLAIALVFRQIDFRMEHDQLEANNMQTQIRLLKAQINPHFYMNMLNNIHALIEVNPDKAQQMVMDLSALMRYMLYDSDRPSIPLAQEVKFLRDYINIMRQRLPEKHLKLITDFASGKDLTAVSIPPLLYLVFVENAFKHGVSYRNESFIDISLQRNHDNIVFHCVNSRHQNGSSSTTTQGGIGLENVKKRISLIYGERANLEIKTTDHIFEVTLITPTYEIKNINH